MNVKFRNFSFQPPHGALDTYAMLNTSGRGQNGQPPKFEKTKVSRRAKKWMTPGAQGDILSKFGQRFVSTTVESLHYRGSATAGWWCWLPPSRVQRQTAVGDGPSLYRY